MSAQLEFVAPNLTAAPPFQDFTFSSYHLPISFAVDIELNWHCNCFLCCEARSSLVNWETEKGEYAELFRDMINSQPRFLYEPIFAWNASTSSMSLYAVRRKYIPGALRTHNYTVLPRNVWQMYLDGERPAFVCQMHIISRDILAIGLGKNRPFAKAIWRLRPDPQNIGIRTWEKKTKLLKQLISFFKDSPHQLATRYKLNLYGSLGFWGPDPITFCGDCYTKTGHFNCVCYVHNF